MSVAGLEDRPFLLSDLLGSPGLDLTLKAGPSEATEVQLSGAHSIEIANPSRWLGRRWVMLTTGVRLRGRVADQRELVAELVENDVSALGFAEDVVFKTIPKAVLEEADKRGFPVFSVPLATGFREVISVVNRSILSSEFRAVQRLTSIQQHLLDALPEADPRQAVINRLARVFDTSITLVIPGEKPLQAGVGPPTADLERTLGSEVAPYTELRLGEWQLFAVPIPAWSGWLVAARRRHFVNALTKPAMQSAVPILIATEQLQNAGRQTERAERAALLEDLISDDAAGQGASLRARAGGAGLKLDIEPGRVLVFGRETCDSRAGDLDPHALAAMLEDQLQCPPPLATALPSGDAVAFVQAVPAAIRTALEVLIAEDPSLLAGVGREASAVDEVRDSYCDALQAAARLRHTTGGERILEYDSFDLGTTLISDASADRIRSKLDETLSVLRENPHLYEALVAYFDHEMDVAVAAETLFIHTNSLRYRLNRIESLLGESLKSPATITNLYLAVTADSGSPSFDPPGKADHLAK